MGEFPGAPADCQRSVRALGGGKVAGPSARRGAGLSGSRPERGAAPGQILGRTAEGDAPSSRRGTILGPPAFPRENEPAQRASKYLFVRWEPGALAAWRIQSSQVCQIQGYDPGPSRPYWLETPPWPKRTSPQGMTGDHRHPRPAQPRADQVRCPLTRKAMLCANGQVRHPNDRVRYSPSSRYSRFGSVSLWRRCYRYAILKTSLISLPEGTSPGFCTEVCSHSHA